MADNMDEFLRRAAERRLQRAKGSGAPPPPPQQQAPPPRNVAPPRQLDRQPPRQSDRETPRQAELAPRSLGKKQPQQKQRSQPKPSLAQKIENADDQMRSHLQSAFNHQVGNLGSNRQGTSGPVTKSPKGDTPLVQPTSSDSDLPLAQQIIEVLKDPRQTKIAFIASEIFQRRF